MLDLAIVDKLNRAGFVVAPYNTPDPWGSTKCQKRVWAGGKPWGQPTRALSVLLQTDHIGEVRDA